MDSIDEVSEINSSQNVERSLRKGQTPAEVAEYYNKWAADNVYDKQMPEDSYTGTAVLAREAAKGLTPEQRAAARVLDVAAGTGLCGVELKKLGFQHLDALDPSQGMLDKAKEKNVYERYICDFITEKPLDIEENSYDLLTIAGALGEGHVPCRAFLEMIRLVKPGGRVVIAMRDSQRNLTEDYKDRLIKEGKWKQLKSEVFQNYLNGMDGLLLSLEIC